MSLSAVPTGEGRCLRDQIGASGFSHLPTQPTPLAVDSASQAALIKGWKALDSAFLQHYATSDPGMQGQGWGTHGSPPTQPFLSNIV